MIDIERLTTALAARYNIERELGTGGMATVYLAHDLKHDRKVAIKVLRPELAAVLGAERFLQEIKTTANLQHPHILPLFDSGEADGFLYYVMPYVAGETLRDKLDRETQLSIEEAVEIATEVADALDYAHRHNVIHRDIKPANILLHDGRPMVADFGIALAVGASGGDRITETGLSLGTPHYMSPEQAAGERELDGRTDVYALACVLYEMLVGETPYVANTAAAVVTKHMADPVPSARRLRATIPEHVDAALMRALAKTPADRFTTPHDFAAALSRSASGVARARPWRQYAALGGIVVAGAITVVFLTRNRTTTDSDLDPNVIAVFPFDAIDPDLAPWQEGFADILSLQLDGAGPLRTVSPSVIIARHRGRADAASTSAVARELGAGLVVFGRLLRTAGDSVRVLATLYDVQAETSVGDLDRRAAESDMDRLADSTAVHLLGSIAKVRRLSSLSSSSMGTRSFPALRAFLRGEQLWRRGQYDSAVAMYDRAIEVDSSFAIARARIALASAWEKGPTPRTTMEAALAGSLNFGLPPRESLFIAAVESYFAYSDRFLTHADVDLMERSESPSFWSFISQFREIAEEGVRRYPESPEFRFLLGDGYYHFTTDVPRSRAYHMWRRAIELDPGSAPNYAHIWDLAWREDGPAALDQYLETYESLEPPVPRYQLEAVHLVRSFASGLDVALDNVNDTSLTVAVQTLILGPADVAEARVQMLRALPLDEELTNWGTVRDNLSYELSYRGHFREALEIRPVASPRSLEQLVDLAALDVVSADTLRAMLLPWADSGRVDLVGAWLLMAGDTSGLRSLGRRAAHALERLPSSALRQRERRAYGVEIAEAYLAIALGDSSAAVDRLSALPDTVCVRCYWPVLVKVRLLSSLGRDQDAAAVFARYVVPPLGLWMEYPKVADVLWELERARVSERLGRRREATKAYRFVADVWRNGDPEAQAFVREARESLARLVSESDR